LDEYLYTYYNYADGGLAIGPKGSKNQEGLCITRMDHSVDTLETSVHAEIASVFNERLVASALISPLGIGFVAWLQMEAVGLRNAVLWSLLIVPVELLIIGFGRAFRTAALQGKPIGPWLLAQFVCCGLLGLAWGMATWFVWASDRFLFYIITLCVLVGVSFICMVVMAPLRRAMPAFAVGLTVLILAQLMTIDNQVNLEIGVGWVVMVAVQWQYALSLRRELVRQIDSSVRNVILVEQLTQVSRELSAANLEKESRNDELKAVMDKLNRLVTFDQLTGAYSRRYFLEELDRQVALHERHRAPVSLVMLDLDHFKLINDQHGHSVGDRALRAAAMSTRSQLREGDMLGRIGGEEFMALLPMTDRTAAVQLAERLRLALEAVELVEGEVTIHIHASMGVAELQPDEDASAWMRRTDEALYLAKNGGRNRVVAAE
jgi:diguanylate cyclase (GGDEF)-like protein